jgi:hypothetical protein
MSRIKEKIFQPKTEWYVTTRDQRWSFDRHVDIYRIRTADGVIKFSKLYSDGLWDSYIHNYTLVDYLNLLTPISSPKFPIWVFPIEGLISLGLINELKELLVELEI